MLDCLNKKCNQEKDVITITMKRTETRGTPVKQRIRTHTKMQELFIW